MATAQRPGTPLIGALGWLRADPGGGDSAGTRVGGWSRTEDSPRCALVPPQALNNVQSTFSGFGFINSENVFKVQASLGLRVVLQSGVGAGDPPRTDPAAVLGPPCVPRCPVMRVSGAPPCVGKWKCTPQGASHPGFLRSGGEDTGFPPPPGLSHGWKAGGGAEHLLPAFHTQQAEGRRSPLPGRPRVFLLGILLKTGCPILTTWLFWRPVSLPLIWG